MPKEDWKLLRVEVLVAYHDTRRHRPRPEPVIRAVETALQI